MTHHDHILRQNRILNILREVNSLIIRHSDQKNTLFRIIEILVKNHDYMNVWVLLLDSDHHYSELISSSEKPEFKELKKQLESNRFPECVTLALTADTPVVIENPLKNCQNCLMESIYEDRSVISQQLRFRESTFGVLVASVPNNFIQDDEEKDLFREICDNISYWLANATEFRLKDQTRALEESRARFDLAMNAARDGLFDWDLISNEIYYSPGWKRIVGYEDGELPNDFSVWEKLTSPEDVERSWEMQKKLIRGEIDQFNIEFRMKHKDGHWVDVLARANVIRDKDGNPLRMIGTHTDISERKKAYKAMRESEERYRGLVDTINSGVAVYKVINQGFSGDDYIIQDFNPTSLELEHATKEQVVGKSLKDIRPNIDEYGLIPIFRKVWETGEAAYYPAKIYEDNNFARFYENRVFRLPFGEIVAIYDDVTEREQAFEKTRSSEEKLYKYINASPFGIFVADEQGRYTDVNATAETVTGYSRKELLDMNLIDLIPESDRHLAKKSFMDLSEKGFNRAELRYRKKDGSLRYWVVTAVKLNDNEFLAFTNDTTEHRLAEIALEESEFKYSQLISSTSEGLWFLNEKHITIEVNDALCQMTGYSREELLGKTPFTFFDESNRAILKKQTAQIKTTLHRTYEIAIRRKDGSLLPVISNATTIMDKNGQLLGSFSLLQDISKLKQTEKDLTAAKEKAEENDRLKSAFLANMSHEIRTPMNGILGFTQILKELDPKDKNYSKYLSIIEQSGDRMLNTINNIINISKIESGQIALNTADVDIESLLDELYIFFKPEALKKGLTLSLKKGLSLEKLKFRSDLDKLSSIFVNLIKNALKYTDKGTVQVSCDLNEETLVFDVKDSGIGIPHSKQEAIFERFIQADPLDKEARQGTGLGLAITKNYVNMLKGSISVSSLEGKGSRFTVKLPVVPIHEDNTPRTPSAADHDRLKDMLKDHAVIIAEDDKFSALYLKELLKNSCNSILLAVNGKEAVTLTREHPETQLVLMDIKMPEMNGLDATRLIRKFNPDVKIVAQTAFAQPEDLREILASGCNDVITKPIDKNKLIDVLERVFD